MLDGIVPPKPEPAPLEPSRKRATDRARDAYMRHHRQALKREARTFIDTAAKYHGQPIEKVIKMLGCRHWTKLTEEEKGVFFYGEVQCMVQKPPPPRRLRQQHMLDSLLHANFDHLLVSALLPRADETKELKVSDLAAVGKSFLAIAQVCKDTLQLMLDFIFHCMII